jgi:hypothetical protein
MCSRVAFFRAPLLEEKQAFLSPWWARHLGPARAREKSILLPYICGPVIGMKIFEYRATSSSMEFMRSCHRPLCDTLEDGRRPDSDGEGEMSSLDGI